MVDSDKVKQIVESSEEWDFIKSEVGKDPIVVVDETCSSGHERLESGLLILDKPIDALYSKVVRSCHEQWGDSFITDALVAYYLYCSCMCYLILKEFVKEVLTISISDKTGDPRDYKISPLGAGDKFIGILKESDELTYTVKYYYNKEPMYFDFIFTPVTSRVADLIPFKAYNILNDIPVTVKINLRTGSNGYTSFTGAILLRLDEFTKNGLIDEIAKNSINFTFKEWYD